MSRAVQSVAWCWQHLMRKAQSNGAVEAWFWRLPNLLRRRIVRLCRIDYGVPASLVDDILRRGTLFIHVPKTAGISVQRSLFDGLLFGHQSVRQYELALSREQLASLFKFAFVRNPWDRLVSAWTFLRDGGYGPTDHLAKEWFAKNAAGFADFESFVLGRVRKKTVESDYMHLKPQAYYLKNSRGRIELDFLGRFENLAEDFQRVSQRLGCQAALQFHNQTRGRKPGSYREHYTPASAEAVARAYEDDIQAFGYEF